MFCRTSLQCDVEICILVFANESHVKIVTQTVDVICQKFIWVIATLAAIEKIMSCVLRLSVGV